MDRNLRKVVVVGVSASGKTTFSRKLSEKLAIPLTAIDAIMWNPGWEYIGDVETRAKLMEIGSGDEWIIEGYIMKDVRAFLFEKADAIIYLDYTGICAAVRYIKRWWCYRTSPRPELPGSPEKFSLKFLWLVYTKGEAISLNKYLASS